MKKKSSDAVLLSSIQFNSNFNYPISFVSFQFTSLHLLNICIFHSTWLIIVVHFDGNRLNCTNTKYTIYFERCTELLSTRNLKIQIYIIFWLLFLSPSDLTMIFFILISTLLPSWFSPYRHISFPAESLHESCPLLLTLLLYNLAIVHAIGPSLYHRLWTLALMPQSI